MSLLYSTNGYQCTGTLSKRGDRQNRKALGPLPFELWAIQNSILDYPKKWIFVCYSTLVYNKFCHRSEPVLAAAIQKVSPHLLCLESYTNTRAFMYQQFRLRLCHWNVARSVKCKYEICQVINGRWFESSRRNWDSLQKLQQK